MATGPKPASDLLTVANQGSDLATSLLKFTSQFRSQNYLSTQLNDLYLNISYTSSLLKDLASNLTAHEIDAKINDGVLEALGEGIGGVFGRVEKAVEKARELVREEKGRIPVGGQGELLILELVEPNAGDEIREGLGMAERSVRSLVTVTRFLTLRKLEKEGKLSPDEKRELEGTSKGEGGHARLVEQFSQTKEWIAELAAKKKTAETQANRTDTGDQRLEIIHREPRIDDDVRSIASFDSFASDQFIDAKELYEGWKIRHNEGHNDEDSRRSWSFLGLRVKEHFDNLGWFSESLLKTDEELKAECEAASTGILTPEAKDYNDKFVATLPGRARQEILFLLQDRERISTNARFASKWQLIDIKAVPSSISTGTWSFWWRAPEVKEWNLIIKGDRIDLKEVKVPVRNVDPFLKSGKFHVHVDRMGPRHPAYPVSQQPLDRFLRREDRPYKRYPETVVGRRPHPVLKALSPEEAEKKLEELLAELGSSNDDKSGEVVFV